MKHILKTSLILLSMLIPVNIHAYDIEVDGIYYNISGSEASVTKDDVNNNSYYGNVTIPETITYEGHTYLVTSIGDRAFAHCSDLTNINIPNTIKSIGKWAFSYCSKLTELTIPDSLLTIDDYAFFDCNYLSSVIIGNSVTTIGTFAFSDCYFLSSVILGSSVTTIGGMAFAQSPFLASIDIPNSVTRIEGSAFFYCTNLTSIYIPASVSYIGNAVCQGCSGLRSISVDCNNPYYDSRENCNAIIDTRNNTLIAGCSNTVVPNSVTTIEGFSFYGCTDLTSINIPNSVTRIGNYAFRDCSSLASITIPDSLFDIGEEVFANTAWFNNQPDGMVYIGFIAYDYKGTFASDTTIIINEGTKGIAGSAFNRCSHLVGIQIPNSVINIGERAFFKCNDLKSVVIPNSVISIASNAFSECQEMTIATIGKSVATLGHSAFGSCAKLNDVFCHIPDPTIVSTDYGVFSPNGNFNYRTLHVPKGTVEAYIATANWYRYFYNIVEMEGQSGDLNGDNIVDVSDVTILIMAILNYDMDVLNQPEADLNHDGSIDVSDIIALIDLILHS